MTSSTLPSRAIAFRKLLRYCGVSVFNLLFGQSLLFFFHSIADWPGWIANVTAVMISAVPAYLLSSTRSGACTR